MDISYSTTLEWDFCTGVPTLQDLTIRSIIQKSWRDAIIQRRQCAKLDKLFNGMYAHITIDSKFQNVKISWSETKTNRQFVNSTTLTSLSEKIQMRMEQYADKLNEEFHIWKHHFDNIIRYVYVGFKKYDRVDNFYYSDDFIYDSYGSIDYTEITKKMWTCDEVGKELRFGFACEFCFEHEIKELWPSVATKLLISRLDEKIWNYSLLWYWVALLTNQLQKVPAHFGSSPHAMFIRFSFTKSAKEFFWKRITAFDNNQVDQVKCIGICFLNCKNPIVPVVLLKYWLPRMSDEFLKSLISLYGTYIITCMLPKILCREFVLPFWQRTCNMFNGDQFATFFVEFSETEDAHIKSICEQIWNIAPIEFKNHASNCIAAKIETERKNFSNSLGRLILLKCGKQNRCTY
ncbi:uncharacterized protein LOC135844307 [Planococcus citri]|uniref:uncharacterized protein LOC135844307 n=1 Tax=Planococcus citri TaxID=170843 RepID=UPI0031F880E1